MLSKWYKQNDKDAVWWLDNSDLEGVHIFSFDKKETFNLFADFPHKLTPEQVVVFIKENPFWADYFSDRLEEYEKTHKDIRKLLSNAS